MRRRRGSCAVRGRGQVEVIARLARDLSAAYVSGAAVPIRLARGGVAVGIASVHGDVLELRIDHLAAPPVHLRRMILADGTLGPPYGMS